MNQKFYLREILATSALVICQINMYFRSEVDPMNENYLIMFNVAFKTALIIQLLK